jgi:hypothetical protein
MPHQGSLLQRHEAGSPSWINERLREKREKKRLACHLHQKTAEKLGACAGVGDPQGVEGQAQYT